MCVRARIYKAYYIIYRQENNKGMSLIYTDGVKRTENVLFDSINVVTKAKIKAKDTKLAVITELMFEKNI